MKFSPRIVRLCLSLMAILAILLASVSFVVSKLQSKAAGASSHTYYVSKSGSNGDGLSWATAWNELNQIKWSVVQPGDTILLDGSSSQMVYTTTLTIGKSGTQGSPITIERSTDAGHNGKVVLFGGRSTPLPYCGQSNYTYQPAPVANGIVFGPASWIVIDGMNWHGISIYGFNSHGVDMTGNPSNDTLRNMEIYDIGSVSQSGGAESPDTGGHGIYLTGANLTFEQIDIHDNADDAFDTGEPSGGVNNITINSSWLHVSREDPTQSGLPFDECTHQDGYQIYAGGTQGGILIENSIVGPGLGEGVILGQVSASNGIGAVVNNVTIKNSLFMGKDINIMGYPQVKESNWTIDHVTVFSLNRGQWQGSYPSAVDLEGTGHAITNSIFYNGPFWLPDGLASSHGNCQWQTTGGTAVVGQSVDPKFITDISSYNVNTPLATFANANYARQSSSPCAGSGSSITSVAQFLSMVNTQSSSSPAATPFPTPTPAPSDPTLTPTPAPSDPTSTPTPVPSSPAATSTSIGQYSIYDGSLNPDWSSNSWGSSTDLANTSPVIAGSKSIAFTANSPWAGLSFYNDAALNTTPYGFLHFFMQASQANQKYGVMIYGSNKWLTFPLSLARYGGNPIPGTWKEYYIPLSALKAKATQIRAVGIQSLSSNPQPAAYVDDIQFVTIANK